MRTPERTQSVNGYATGVTERKDASGRVVHTQAIKPWLPARSGE